METQKAVERGVIGLFDVKEPINLRRRDLHAESYNVATTGGGLKTLGIANGAKLLQMKLGHGADNTSRDLEGVAKIPKKPQELLRF